MEAMNGWLYFPIHERSLSQEDLAIRRFCPARVLEQEQAAGEPWEETLMTEIELLRSPADTTSEEEEFVDSFFNMDCYDQDTRKFPEKNEVFGQNFQDLGDLSMVNDEFGDISMMFEGDELEMMSCSFDDDPQTMPAKTREEAMACSYGVDQGLHLVHLLLACAEAVGCRDTQLADSMLGQIWPSVSPWGDSLQRVSYCFATGLKSRLSLLHKLNANGTFSNAAAMEASLITKEEKMEAFQLLHQATPYIAFGFMAANDAISQAAQGKDFLHIVDLGMEHTLQWPSLIRALASRAEGAPKSLRITGIVGAHQNCLALKASIESLIDESSSLGIPLELHLIEEPASPALLTKEKLNLREGEALFVNSIMHLHEYVKESRGSLKTVLQAIRKLGPIVLTVVEQDANHNGPFFLGRFLESLHYYSAIFDALEASLPRNSPQRMKIEKLHFAEEIRNIVAFEGSDRIERHERADQWRRQLGRAGFQAVGLKGMSQARMMLAVYGCDGYTLTSDKGCLLLGWKGRPIMLASAWQVPSDHSKVSISN
ncbi:GRAS family protein RAD1-like [Diospyros lotus]|uniref:GRAS family protein RAD1-like n=1 Tax=Diospyros lotus TaxID=55363 RepID=UPI0022567CA9|nr:GRAS family protein RAD1-like [Diospyros lotus]